MNIVKSIILLLLILSINAMYFQAKSQQIKANGIYQSKNLYVLNPYRGTEQASFCIDSVWLNSKRMLFSDTTSAFEAFLNDYLELGDSVYFIIFHNKTCLPKIMNPEVFIPWI
ncbi:MAG: hypothetical protein HRT71_18515 [Flavobacteriales bacterium]|nr:hypothetical protein [Flavobacteriales bacterium]